MNTPQKNKNNTDSDRRGIVIEVVALTVLEIPKQLSLEGRDGKR